MSRCCPSPSPSAQRLTVVACALLLAAGLMAGCGSGDVTFTPSATTDPEPPPTATTPRERIQREGPSVTVVADRRFVELRWTAEGRSGSGVLVSRRWPRSDERGPYRFRFLLPGAPQGEVTLAVRASLPFTRTETVTTGLSTGSAEIDLRDDRPCAFTTCTPKAPADGPGIVHVAARGGDDDNDGSAGKPFATIGRALEADGVKTVLVAPGRYAGWRDTTKRRTAVTVQAAVAERPVLEGAVLTGSGLRLVGLAFEGGLGLGDKDAPAADTVVTQSTVTGPGYVGCLGIAPGSTRIVLRDNWFRSCRNAIGAGFSGDADGPDTTRVRIEGNLIEDMYGDGVQLTKWRDVLIRHNVIRDLRGREYDDHNDGVQIVGGGQAIRIIGNEFRTSDNQMVLIGEDFGLQTRDVLVASNLMFGAGSWAINNFGASDVRIVNNTVWGGKVGAVILGTNKEGGKPENTLIANNILDRIFLQGDVQPGRRKRNIVGRDPGFLDPTYGDLRLRAGSPARQRAARDFAPRTDLGGVLRGTRPAIGAYR